MVYVNKLSTLEAEAGGFCHEFQPGLLSKALFQKKKNDGLEKAQCQSARLAVPRSWVDHKCIKGNRWRK